MVEADGASVTVPMDRLTIVGIENLPTATAVPAGASGASRAASQTPTAKPTPGATATPTAAPTANMGDWTAHEYDLGDATARSVELEAYWSGYLENDQATLSVSCVAPQDGRAKYPNVAVFWEKYHGLHGDDISVILEWDNGGPQFQDWVGLEDGDTMFLPFSTTSRHDKAFINLLTRFDHLEISARGELDFGWGKFNLDGFDAAYEPVKQYCAA